MAENFKVVVVGAGPVGLVLLHALSRAGIDFICLERATDPLKDIGASLVLTPASMRVMSQLGIYDDVVAISVKIQQLTTFNAATGGQWDSSGLTEVITRDHGIPLLVCHRADLVNCLFNKLSKEAQAKIVPQKTVQNIESLEKGVIVECEDGTSYQGSIGIGANGTNSVARRMMSSLANRFEQDATEYPVSPYKSEYTCLWFTCPPILEPGHYFETQNSGRSVIMMTSPKRTWVLLFEKQPEVTNGEKQSRRNEIEYAAKFADFLLSNQYRVKDLFPWRTNSGITKLEEGMAKHWYYRRIVLVGDACHKMTPNAALGFNIGLQDTIVLCNSLRGMIGSDLIDDAQESAVEDVFREYEPSRKEGASRALLFSSHFTRVQA